MSTLWSVNGLDLSFIFESRNGTTAYSTLQGIKYLGIDLTSIFMARDIKGSFPVSSPTSITNISYNHIDLGDIFQLSGITPGITLRQTISSGSGNWYSSSFSAILGFTPKFVIVSVIGGGGGGSHDITGYGGTGGAGGGHNTAIVDVSSGVITYSVGAGGNGGSSTTGSPGSNTTFGTLSVTGGDGGGYNTTLPLNIPAAQGGSPNGGRGGTYSNGSGIFPTVGNNSDTITTYNGSIYLAHGSLYGTYAWSGGASVGNGGSSNNSWGNYVSPTIPGGGGGGGSGITNSAGYAGARGEIRIYY
jgi:hypothetical protein